MGIRIIKNNDEAGEPESFYLLKATSITGEEISFEKYKGKKVLIVNLASECGYTPQYAELERLYQESAIIVLGFPSNNFGAQEPASDTEIAKFCSMHYGVTFQLFKKDNVKIPGRQAVYEWLTDKTKNGWNSLEPQWNFYKYVVDEKGNLSTVLSSSVSPVDIPFILKKN